MTGKKGGATVNQGPAPKPDDEAAESKRGEERSPAARDRGETSSADRPAPVDLDTAHDRAS